MAIEVDRRKFLTAAGAAGAATGALWVAPSVLGSSNAYATGSIARCTDSQTLNWTSIASTMPAPSTTGAVSYTAAIAAVGANPAIDVKITVTPILTPGPGSYSSGGTTYSGTGGVNFAGAKTDGLGTHNSYYMAFMLNNALNEGYTFKFEFFDAGTSTPRSVYNLDTSLGGLTVATGTTGYVDTVWTDKTFTTTQGSAVSGTGTSTTPWKGTTSSDTNSWVTLDHASAIDNFTISYTNTTRFGVSEWVWINDLTWC